MLVSLEEHILSELKEGAKLSDVYKSAVNFVKKESPDLVEKLTKNFGFAMGIEFREGSLSITPTCDAIVKKGMTWLPIYDFAYACTYSMPTRICPWPLLGKIRTFLLRVAEI